MCKHRPEIRVHCRYSCCVKMLLTGKGDEMTSENMYRELHDEFLSYPMYLSSSNTQCRRIQLSFSAPNEVCKPRPRCFIKLNLTNVMFLEKTVIILNAGGIYNWFE